MAKQQERQDGIDPFWQDSNFNTTDTALCVNSCMATTRGWSIRKEKRDKSEYIYNVCIYTYAPGAGPSGALRGGCHRSEGEKEMAIGARFGITTGW